MSDMRYFKKSYPKQRVMLSTGIFLEFTFVDHETGILGHNDPNLLGQIDDAIANHRGGITEISSEEFQELLKKKGQTPLMRPWREEYSKEGIAGALAAGVLQAKVPMEIPGPHEGVAVPAAISPGGEFKPPVASKRK